MLFVLVIRRALQWATLLPGSAAPSLFGGPIWWPTSRHMRVRRRLWPLPVLTFATVNTRQYGSMLNLDNADANADETGATGNVTHLAYNGNIQPLDPDGCTLLERWRRRKLNQ